MFSAFGFAMGMLKGGVFAVGKGFIRDLCMIMAVCSGDTRVFTVGRGFIRVFCMIIAVCSGDTVVCQSLFSFHVRMFVHRDTECCFAFPSLWLLAMASSCCRIPSSSLCSSSESVTSRF